MLGRYRPFFLSALQATSTVKASLIGATYVAGFGALAGTTEPGTLPILRRALRKLGALRLRDLGLTRDAC